MGIEAALVIDDHRLALDVRDQQLGRGRQRDVDAIDRAVPGAAPAGDVAPQQRLLVALEVGREAAVAAQRRQRAVGLVGVDDPAPAPAQLAVDEVGGHDQRELAGLLDGQGVEVPDHDPIGAGGDADPDPEARLLERREGPLEAS